MSLLRKAAISAAALSMIAAPVAASAASAIDGVRATSASEGQNAFGGKSSWLIGLAGLVAGVTAFILIADNNDDNDPVSP